MRYVTPVDLWRTGWQVWIMAYEAQLVIGYRMMGMAGLWNTTRSETSRMVSEKQHAAASSVQAVASAMAKGKLPHHIVAAAVKPVRARTKSNVARLAARGPRRLGPGA
jgi:hypothetical protein